MQDRNMSIYKETKMDIKVDDGTNVTVMKRHDLLKAIDDFINDPNNVKTSSGAKKTFTYLGFTCEVKYIQGWFCGYVRSFDLLIKEKFTDDEMSALELIDNIYVPHGDFTASTGFDCCHYDDIMISTFSTRDDDKSFKTEDYVVNEIKKIVDSIIAIAASR